MMTGMQRFGALMAGQIPDRVPIVCNLLDHGASELGVSLRDYYASGARVAEGQLRLREKYGYDTLLGMFYSALEAEVLGCRQIIYADDGPPNIGHLVIQSDDDIRRLQVPYDLEGHPRFREVATCIRTLKQEAAGRWPVLGVVTASFSLPAMLMGVGPWMKLFLTGDPGLRDALLAKCSMFCSRQIMALREAGSDLIVYVNPVASATFITLKQFNRLALPWVLRDLAEHGSSGVVYFNGGGRINPMVTALHQEAGIGAFYLNPFDDIAEARSNLGPQALIAGAINDIQLINWTPEEIDLEVSRIMTAGKGAAGFIFGTLLMPFKIPEGNIKALVDAAIKHGCYKKESR